MIAIIDYGMGNLRSVEKALARVGQRAVVTGDPQTIAAAGGVVLPGVGAFGNCMRNLREYGLADVVRATVAAGKPFLGICLGLQLLFTEGEEEGRHPGLGILPGTVKRITGPVKVPHMGWNRLRVIRPNPLFAGVPDGSFVYFVHSYYAMPLDPAVVTATTDYGGELPVAVARDNVYAVQFHPEKSGDVGLLMLKNFGELVR